MPTLRTALRRPFTPVASSTPDASLALPLSIVTYPQLTPLQKVTLALIAATGNQQQATLARWIGASRRAVAGAIAHLRGLRLLEVFPRGSGQGNAYIVRLPPADARVLEIIEAVARVEESARRETAGESRAARSGDDYARYCAALRSMREEIERDHHGRIESEWHRITRRKPLRP